MPEGGKGQNIKPLGWSIAWSLVRLWVHGASILVSHARPRSIFVPHPGKLLLGIEVLAPVCSCIVVVEVNEPPAHECFQSLLVVAQYVRVSEQH